MTNLPTQISFTLPTMRLGPQASIPGRTGPAGALCSTSIYRNSWLSMNDAPRSTIHVLHPTDTRNPPSIHAQRLCRVFAGVDACRMAYKSISSPEVIEKAIHLIPLGPFSSFLPSYLGKWVSRPDTPRKTRVLRKSSLPQQDQVLHRLRGQ